MSNGGRTWGPRRPRRAPVPPPGGGCLSPPCPVRDGVVHSRDCTLAGLDVAVSSCDSHQQEERSVGPVSLRATNPSSPVSLPLASSSSCGVPVCVSPLLPLVAAPVCSSLPPGASRPVKPDYQRAKLLQRLRSPVPPSLPLSPVPPPPLDCRCSFPPCGPSILGRLRVV